MSSFEDNDGVEDTFHDCIEPYSASEEHDVETENNLSGGEKNITEEETSLVENSQKDVNKALEYKNNGNEAFKNRDFDAAIQCYSMALSYCPEDDFSLLSTLYGNRSASYFAEEEFDLVIEDCSASLNAKPDYLKVLARRMQTYEKLEKFEEALAGKIRINKICYSIIIFYLTTFCRCEKITGARTAISQYSNHNVSNRLNFVN